MPDSRKHRGPHPDDRQLFADERLAGLQDAQRDLNWLVSRGYAWPSSTKIVGDRYSLTARQRIAVARCCCSDQSLSTRGSSLVPAANLAGHELWVDGYNVLTSIEAALSGGVILRGKDACYRDMASMHGSYRRVTETLPAIKLLGTCLSQLQVDPVHWLFDQPVSNSGRLKQLMLEQAELHGWNWHVELVPDPDPLLAASTKIVASSDSQILDAASQWFNLARAVIDKHIPDAWIVPVAA